MNYSDFNYENDDNDDRVEFLIELSDMLTYLNPPLVDFDETEITSETYGSGDYFKVIIPHKINKNINLSISVYPTEIIVFFSKQYIHFEHYEEIEEKMIEAICFISELLLGKVEICSYYKGDKLIKVNVYYLNEENKKELIIAGKHSKFAMLNPFSKISTHNEKITFFD